jgi:uncharacterized membrane protein
MFKKILFILLGIITTLIIGFIAIGFIKPVCKTQTSVTVNAPASKTFAIFNDTANMRVWMDNYKSIKHISGEKNEVGSKWELRFDENGRDMVIMETITAFEQDKLFAFEFEDEFAKFNVEIHFDEANGQTVISQTSTGEGKGMAARSMIAIMSGAIEKQQTGMYNKLKALVEKL